MQFNSLMESINEYRVRQRIAQLYDGAQSAQGTSKSLKGVVKKLERSVDIHKDSMGSADDFKREFGAGI